MMIEIYHDNLHNPLIPMTPLAPLWPLFHRDESMPRVAPSLFAAVPGLTCL